MVEKINLDWVTPEFSFCPDKNYAIPIRIILLPNYPNGMKFDFRFNHEDYKKFTNFHYDKEGLFIRCYYIDYKVPHYSDYRMEEKLISREQFCEIVQVRPNQAQAKAWNKFAPDLKVGDFVKCKGTRYNGWRLVTKIVWKESKIYNTQYSKPINDSEYMQPYSSDNFIWTIKEKYNDST